MNLDVQNAVLTETTLSDVEMNRSFSADVKSGLSSSPKKLQSKYFYDAAGDKLFQEIMHCEDYYLTNCELEIFSQQTADLATLLTDQFQSFDLIELGAGDATKSVFLLDYLLKNEVDFTYLPIDISTNVIDLLEEKLPQQFPNLKMKGLNGDYFDMLKEARSLSSRPKVVLFMGSNIGNMPVKEAYQFCATLRNELSADDLLIVGFDLKKNPKTVLAAYNDREGITRKFNLNLLKRINRELNADFDLTNFDHYPTYDPQTGACRSFLVSLTDQQVHISNDVFHFAENELIDMEVSQKYNLAEIDLMANQSGFVPIVNFFDSKKWFVDAVWKCG